MTTKIKSQSKILKSIFRFSALIIPQNSYAGAVPIVYINWLPMVLFFIMVVYIKQAYIKRAVQIQRIKIIWYTFLVNILTTFFFVPLMWVFIVILQVTLKSLLHIKAISVISQNDSISLLNILYFITLKSFIYDGELSTVLENVLLTFVILLLYIPAFYMSFYIEYNLLKLLTKTKNIIFLKKNCFKANFVSYLILYSTIFFLFNPLL